PKFQYIVTGLYQAAYGINLGANVNARQGYAMPYNQSPVATGDPLGGNKALLLVPEVTTDRLSMVTEFDVRVGKEFRFSQRRVNLDFDIFNILNNNTVLGRQYNLRTPSSANTVLEIQNPRIARIGLRFNF